MPVRPKDPAPGQPTRSTAVGGGGWLFHFFSPALLTPPAICLYFTLPLFGQPWPIRATGTARAFFDKSAGRSLSEGVAEPLRFDTSLPAATFGSLPLRVL